MDLSERANNELEDFIPLIHELTHTEGHKLYQFGLEIGRKDNDRKFFQYILDSQCGEGKKGETQFIGGYLLALREGSESDWENLIAKFLFDDKFSEIAGQLIWRTGVNANILKQMLRALAKGILKPSDFAVLRFSKDTNNLDQSLVEEVLFALLACDEKDALFIALEIADTLYINKDVFRQIPRDLGFELLTKSDLFTDKLDTMQGYHWGELSKKYIDTYPDRDLELFSLIMSNLKNWRFMSLKSTSPFHAIAEKVARKKPTETWEIIQSFLVDLKTDQAHGILCWLEEERHFGERPGIRPLTYFPADAVFGWIDGNPETRAPVIARAAPKTLDKNGDGFITRELLNRYGHMARVKSALSGNFYTDGWSGPASEHYRKKRDNARTWLNGEKSQNVIEWLEEHIDSLNSQIQSEEIREEREFYD